MHRNLRKIALVGLALAAASIPGAALFAQANTGSASFTTYVSLGDSLTAGFISGSLIETVQVNSYPAIIERQATGSDTGFEQPLVTPPGIPPIIQLKSLLPLSFGNAAGIGQPANLKLPRPYNNLGVPGARVHDLVATTNGGLHDLILRNPNFHNTTALVQALSQHPTFVTLWIGNNDVLAAATSGVVIDNVTLTTVASFQADFTAAVQAIAASGAKMAIANIPDVTSLPFVTTLPPILLNPATNKPVIFNGGVVRLIGPHGPLGPGDHVLLTAAAELAKGIGIPAPIGTGKPLTDDVVLDAQETATIEARLVVFNGIIASVGNQFGAALVDTNALLKEAASTGIDVGGFTFTSAFLTGGIFSYDGVHPTPFGYAFVANAFIDAINAKFGAQIPEADLSPFMFGPAASGGVLAASTGAGIFSDQALRNLAWIFDWPQAATTPTPKPPQRKHRGH